MKEVGILSKRTRSILLLSYAKNTKIYIKQKNEKHIKGKHKEEYKLHFAKLESILKQPDFVGFREKDKSLSFVRKLPDGKVLKIAVREDEANHTLYVRTMYFLKEKHFENGLQKGTYIRYEKGAKRIVEEPEAQKEVTKKKAKKKKKKKKQVSVCVEKEKKENPQPRQEQKKKKKKKKKKKTNAETVQNDAKKKEAKKISEKGKKTEEKKKGQEKKSEKK